MSQWYGFYSDLFGPFSLPKRFGRKIKCLAEKHFILRWHRLWIRKDEFDKSLNLNVDAMLVMSKKEQERYLNDLAKRRHIAHERDLARSTSR